MDEMSKQVYAILDKEKNPTLQEILSLLRRADALPSFNQSHGNSFNRKTGAVSISPNSFTLNSFAHEYTHALDQLMGNYKDHDDLNKKPTQFGNAFEKFGQPVEQLLPFPLRNQWEQYRYSPIEARAWAVGNMENKDGFIDGAQRPPPPHLDATLATEAAILRELFGRRLKSEGK